MQRTYQITRTERGYLLDRLDAGGWMSWHRSLQSLRWRVRELRAKGYRRAA